jgi:glutathione S-transferase
MKLHQFQHSPFSEKVRLVLAAKRIPYSVVEVLPGMGQLDLLRRAGQRQVPVLQDGDTWIGDSTAIALHLERLRPDPPLLPQDPAARAEVLLLEDWADTTLAGVVRLAILRASFSDGSLRGALLPLGTPDGLRRLAGSIPDGWLGRFGQLLPIEAATLEEKLDLLTSLLEARPWLVADQPTLADLAVAAQLYPLRFPAVAGAELAYRGVPGIADQPRYEPLFHWRDGLYQRLGRGSMAATARPMTIPVE